MAETYKSKVYTDRPAYVDPLNWCDYFANKEKKTLTDTINRQLRSEQE